LVFIKEIMKIFASVGKISLNIEEFSGKEKFLDTPDFFIESREMTHNSPCLAYSFVEKDKIKINKDKLQKLKIPSGPFLKRLKEGKNIIYNQKRYLAKDLTFVERGKKISFVLDTSFNKKIISFVKNSDILICESSFSEELNKKAEEYGHLTSKQAAEIAKKSFSKKLILTHLSQRYNKNQENILNEAIKVFNNSVLAKDFDNFEI